jgi:hypothetical protein
MRERERREGGAHMGRGRALGARRPRPGRAGPGQAGLGHTAGQNLAARTTTDWKPNAK